MSITSPTTGTATFEARRFTAAGSLRRRSVGQTCPPRVQQHTTAPYGTLITRSHRTLEVVPMNVSSPTDETEGYELLRIERRGAALIIVLNRPERLNAINGQLHDELRSALREVELDADSRVVVLTGAGRAFCSGGDVSGMTGESGSGLRRRDYEVHSPGRHLVDALLSVEKPVIAMINGPAVGLGATLALLCDVTVMSEGATIGDRHVNVGLVAGDGGAVIWPLLIGVARAKELLMTGRLLNGEDAARIGLVTHAVSAEELEAYTFTVAEELASLPPYAVRATKASVNRQLRRMVEEDLDTSLAWERLSMFREDHREAARAFLNRTRS